VEWGKKVMKQEEKLRKKKETEKIFIDNALTKQEREIQKKLKSTTKEEKREAKEVQVGYRKITINNRVGRVEME
jgi:predicted ATPase